MAPVTIMRYAWWILYPTVKWEEDEWPKWCSENLSKWELVQVNLSNVENFLVLNTVPSTSCKCIEVESLFVCSGGIYKYEDRVMVSSEVVFFNWPKLSEEEIWKDDHFSITSFVPLFICLDLNQSYSAAENWPVRGKSILNLSFCFSGPRHWARPSSIQPCNLSR